jgi:hypothetical protein
MRYPNIDIWTITRKLSDTQFMIELKATHEGVDYLWKPPHVYTTDKYTEKRAADELTELFYTDILNGYAPKEL